MPKIIVIIEDDSATQKLYKEALSTEGFEVVQYFNGNVVMPKIREDNPNLILLDIMLPGKKNGFDLLEEIKKDPILKKVPVIMLTNLDSEEQVAKQIGATDYVVKANISIADLVKKIKETL